MNFLEKVGKLPEEVKDFFTSNECRFEFEKSFFSYGIDIDNSKNLSKEIGMIFVGDERLINLPNIILKNITPDQRMASGLAYEINKRIFNKFPDYFKDSQDLLKQWEQIKSNPIISEGEAYEKLVELEPWMAESEKEERDKKTMEQEEYKQKLAKLLNLSVVKSINTYPKIGEQAITFNPIKLKIFPQPVRPSIKNWIEDYHSAMGVEKHEMMERGNYIYHSENAKRLTSGERKKLAEILRSLDEGVALSIDPDRQEVVFHSEESDGLARQEERNSSASFQMPEQTRDQGVNNFKLPQDVPIDPSNYGNDPYPGSLKFSSPHTFPSEKKPEQRTGQQSAGKPLPPRIATQGSSSGFSNPRAGKPWVPDEDKKAPTIRGNVVNLKN